jgi:glycosyltransferase involved in cell wall biosynthesis
LKRTEKSLINVHFDREIFNLQKFGGVSKSFSSIISVFIRDVELGVEPHLTFSRSSNYHLNQAIQELLPGRGFLNATSGLSTLLTLGPVRELSSHFAGGVIPRGPQGEIFHATYYRPTYAERSKGKKLAITIHDFIPEALGWTGLRNPHIGKRALAQRADLVIAVSQTTADEISERYKIEKERIRVVHHGVQSPAPNPKVKSQGLGNYVLYVGHRGGYKNFSVLLRVMEILVSEKMDLRLKLCGPPPTSVELFEINSRLGEDMWDFIPSPTEDELNDLYSGAFAHVVTSKMEGFGMTILESMANGTPTIVSDIPVFREVAGEAGIFFDPNSPESLASAIWNLAGSDVRKRASHAALTRAKTMSWERSAEMLANAYQSII